MIHCNLCLLSTFLWKWIKVNLFIISDEISRKTDFYRTFVSLHREFHQEWSFKFSFSSYQRLWRKFCVKQVSSLAQKIQPSFSLFRFAISPFRPWKMQLSDARVLSLIDAMSSRLRHVWIQTAITWLSPTDLWTRLGQRSLEALSFSSGFDPIPNFKPTIREQITSLFWG